MVRASRSRQPSPSFAPITPPKSFVSSVSSHRQQQPAAASSSSKFRTLSRLPASPLTSQSATKLPPSELAAESSLADTMKSLNTAFTSSLLPPSSPPSPPPLLPSSQLDDLIYLYVLRDPVNIYGAIGGDEKGEEPVFAVGKGNVLVCVEKRVVLTVPW